MRFTVFTPAYNRAYCLERLYQSLKRQSFRDFEWIIIDDGSTDNTEEVVNGFLRENNFFPIRYRKVQNGGKHRAFNIAVQMAEGELFTCVDSDDYLTDDALFTVDQIEKTIPDDQKNQFAGVCGQRCGSDLVPLKGSFTNDSFLDITYIERIQKRIVGDCSEVFYTAVWRHFPYMEYPGENFLTEATVLFEMADAGLKMRFFNRAIKVTEYLPDGLTANSRERFRKNPRGWGLYIYQRIKYGMLSGFGKWEVITEYYSSSKKMLSLREIARILHLRPFFLLRRIIGMRIIYKIYR